MKTKKVNLALLSIALPLIFVSVHSVRAQGTTFTYQGRLLDASSPASGNYDLRFTVWDSAVGGLQVGGAVVVAPVAVNSGLFTVPLDFGDTVFTCPARWLQIESRVFGGGSYSTITPRQKITAAPYAITAGSLCGTLPAVQLSGTVADGNLSANVALLNRNPKTFTGQNNFTANVGIGLTSPLTPLHAREGTGAGGLGIYNTPVIFSESQHGNGIIGMSAANGLCGVLGLGTSLNGGVGVCAYGGSYGITAQGADYGGSFTATGGSGIGVYASGSPAIYASGNVGIGTGIPDRSLTIANGSGANFMNIKDGTHEILMGVDAGGGIISVISAHDLILRAGGNSEKMRIQAGGNVGIGTATPTAQLDAVQGTGSGVGPDSAAIIGDAQTDSDGIWGASGAGGGNGVVGVCNNGTSAYGVWGRSTSGRG